LKNKNHSREKAIVRSILLIIIVLASIAMIKEVTLTGFVASENKTNELPFWQGNTTWQINKNQNKTFNLNNYFKDPDNDILTYLATESDKVSISVVNNMLTISPDLNFTGERTISILASDEFDAVRVNIKLLIGTDEERALHPVNITEIPVNCSTCINTTDEINQTAMPDINITKISINVSYENFTNDSVVSSLETEDNKSIRKFEKNEKIKDKNDKHVGKKVDDEKTFETFFTKIEKNQTELLVEFHHNATTQQPIWIEGDINYTLSKTNAEPLENITIIVKRVKGIIPKFKLHIGEESDIFEFGKTVPSIVFNGKSELTDRNDEKIDIKLSKQNTKAEIKGAVDVEFINAKVISIEDKTIKTNVFAANNVSMDNATIALPKKSNINTIMECPDFNTITESCPSNWIKTNTLFIDNGTHIIFTVNHFSGYAGAEINILNVQSYPTVGGNWEVRFTTQGTANLTIEAVDGTTWSNTNENNDLKFLELKCGQTTKNYQWINNKVFIENYNCNSTGHEISKVLTSGGHHLKFEFGSDVAYANNLASGEWRTVYNHTNFAITEDIAIDSADNSIVIGSINNGGSNYYDWMTIKYNSSGIQKWNFSYDHGNSNDTSKAVDVDSSDNFVIVGTVNFTENGDSIFLIKFDQNNNHLWNKTFSVGYFDWARDVVVDNSDNVIVATTNGSDCSILKFDQNGVHQWNVSYGHNVGLPCFVGSIAVDSDDNITAIGSNYGIFPGLIKFDSSGNHLWNSTSINGTEINIDSSDNIFVIRSGSTLDSENISKFDCDGDFQWSTNFSYLISLDSIDFDSSENVSISGTTGPVSYFTDNRDIFIVKLNNSNGAQIVNRTYDSNFRDCKNYEIESDYNIGVDSLDYNIVSGVFAAPYPSSDNNWQTIKFLPNLQVPPTIINAVLNTSAGKNRTDENLTLFVNSSDENGDEVKDIITWYKDYNSILLLNMPFEGGSAQGTADGVANGTFDYSGQGNNGTVYNASWSSDLGFDSYGAYNFTGNGRFVKTDLLTTKTTDITLMMWIKPAVSSQSAFIFNNGGNNGYGLFMGDGSCGSGSEINVFLGGVTCDCVSSSTTLSASVWSHIALSRSGTQWRLYKDGVLKHTGTTNPNNPTAGGTSIGASRSGSSGFNGIVDEVMFFNKTLSTEQIKAIYENKTDIIVSQETEVGDVWHACVTPNDGNSDGAEVCSNNVTVILSNFPVISNVKLNCTSKDNSTNDNLTAFWDADDSDNDAVKNITNWYLNGTSITVLNMPFEPDGDKNTTDFSGFENNGTVVGATYGTTKGYDGKGAYEFDGSSDYINIPDNPGLRLTNEVSIAAWVKMDDAGNNIDPNQYIVTKSSGVTVNTIAYELVVLNAFPAGDYLSFRVSNGTNTGRADLDFWGLSSSRFYHVVGTFNGTTVVLYVNGTAVDSGEVSGPIRSDTTNLRIGNRADNSRYFNGIIDDVIIYNRSLSAEQVKALYENRTDLIVSQETNVDEIWKVCVAGNDGYNNGSVVCSNNVTIIKQVPTTTSIILNSSFGTNLTSENITCYINATDIQNISLIAHFNWYNQSVLYSSGSTPITRGILTNISTIDSSLTKNGENWTCKAKVWDGTYNETNWNTASLIIGNTAPVHDSMPFLNSSQMENSS